MKTFAITYTVVVNITGVTTCNTSQWRLNVFSTNCRPIFFPRFMNGALNLMFWLLCDDSFSVAYSWFMILISDSWKLNSSVGTIFETCKADESLVFVFCGQRNINFDVGKIFRAWQQRARCAWLWVSLRCSLIGLFSPSVLWAYCKGEEEGDWQTCEDNFWWKAFPERSWVRI